jgi:hypothetical protein
MYPMGENMLGQLQYMYNLCDANGIIMREQCYWNRQDNPDIPNAFWHDHPTAVTANGYTFPAHSTMPDVYDMAKAWHDWVPGKRLPDL